MNWLEVKKELKNLVATFNQEILLVHKNNLFSLINNKVQRHCLVSWGKCSHMFPPPPLDTYRDT